MLAAVAVVGAVLATSEPAAAQQFTCQGREATIVGTPGNDRIEGTPRQDVIVALEGRDVIFGREGNDIICGGPGGDVIKGGAGKDQLEGGGGNDRIIGGIGKDTIVGGPGKDRILAGGGGDIIDGGKSSDLVNGQNGNDTCELDQTDRFTDCELGDVVGLTGFADGLFPLEPPADFIVYRTGAGGGPALQALEVADVFIFGVNIFRNGGDLTTVRVYDGDVLLSETSSINEFWFAELTVWGSGTHIEIDTGGNMGSFYVGYYGPDVVTRFAPNGATGEIPSVIVMDPPAAAAGPEVFNFSIGPDVSGGAYVLLYADDGDARFAFFEVNIGPETARTISVLVDKAVAMIEIFATGSWEYFWSDAPTP